MEWYGMRKSAVLPRNGINWMSISRETRLGLQHYPASQNNGLSRYWMRIWSASADEGMRCLQDEMKWLIQWYRETLLNWMKLYTIVKMGSQSAGEQYSSQGRFAERFTIYLTILLQYFYSLFYFSFVTNKGMDVAGVPLFCATYSFGFWEQLPATGFAFILRAAVAEMRFLLLVLGSVTGRCLYLGSLNEGCKGWECSRDNLYLGLRING